MYEDVADCAAFDETTLSLCKESRVAYLASAYLTYSGAVKDTEQGLFQFRAALGKEDTPFSIVPSQQLYYK